MFRIDHTYSCRSKPFDFSYHGNVFTSETGVMIFLSYGCIICMQDITEIAEIAEITKTAKAKFWLLWLFGLFGYFSFH